jgi:hypothetical protein
LSQETCPYNIEEEPVKCIHFFKTSISKWALQVAISGAAWL